MGIYISLQFIVISIISSQFPARSSFFLYYNNGDIKVLSLTNNLLWTTISFFLYFGVICILHFCLSQLINDIFYFTIVAAITTVALMLVMVYFSYNKFILAINITMDNIYENNISVGYYLSAFLFKYAVVSSLLVATYYINKKRKLKGA